MSIFHFLSKIRKERKKKYYVQHSFQSDIELQEVFLDSLAQKKEKEIGCPSNKLEVALSQKGIKIMFVLILLISFLFLFRVFQLQVFGYQKYKTLAEENKFIFSSLDSFRGVIYDTTGKQLVSNKPTFDLILNKDKFFSFNKKRRDEILKNISLIINQDINDLKNKINSAKENNILISENLDRQKLIILESRINDFSGFWIKENLVRYYPEAAIFSHILGYTSLITKEELKNNSEIYSPFDYVGRAGLEKEYEEFLRKEPGEMKIERDAQGNVVSKEVIVSPRPGKSLMLWLNADLQKIAEQSLEKYLKKSGTDKGVIVALDPNTGGVLSLVSIPGYDNNLFSKGADKKALEELLLDKEKKHPFLNRAIAGLYPTGSVIKPLIAAAVLEEKIISPYKKLYCEDKIIIPNKYNPDKYTIKRDWAFHGWTDMRKAIAESSDVYFYTIGGGYKDQEGLGPTKIKKYLQLFGWGEKTGIDLPGEKKGLIPSPQWKKKVKGVFWWDGDTYNLSIGQGDVLATPIQVATSFVPIANGGILYQPRIVKEIVDEKKNIIKEFKPEVIRKDFINPQNLKIVKEGMRWAVTGENSPLASAKILNDLPVPVAAKTGTAETIKEGYFDNWVVVLAPYDKPEIVLLVMMEKIKGLREAVLPVAKEILQWYFENK